MRAVLVVTLLSACGAAATDSAEPPGPTDWVALPIADGREWVEDVDNPYFPLPAGGTWSIASSDLETTVEITVTAGSKAIMGVQATVVQDIEYEDGEVAQETLDWFAQDSTGTVWHLGEETCTYEDGACADTEGSWEWGSDGALAGVMMWADPASAEYPYYQEWYEGHAEDVGQVLEVGVSLAVAAGQFDDCIQTWETSTLDTTGGQGKYFCRDIGIVLVEGDGSTEELVDSSLLNQGGDAG